MEVVAVIGCVAAIVQAFQQGDMLVKRLRVKRAARKKGLPPEQLEASLALGPPAVRQGFDSGTSRYGTAFEAGDRECSLHRSEFILTCEPRNRK